MFIFQITLRLRLQLQVPTQLVPTQQVPIQLQVLVPIPLQVIQNSSLLQIVQINRFKTKYEIKMYHFSFLGCKSDTWPDVKKGKICDDCLALIKIKSYGTCGKYCKSLGLACVSAYEEVSNTCTIESTFGCDTKVLGSDGKVTSDALCKCTADTGSTGITNLRMQPRFLHFMIIIETFP